MTLFCIRRAPDLRCGKAAQRNGPALADPLPCRCDAIQVTVTVSRRTLSAPMVFMPAMAG